MIEFISGLHPFFVYFTIGLLSTSAILYLVGYILKKQDAKKAVQNMALWLLWGGAGVTVLAIASGFWAYSAPDLDSPANLAVKGHRNWALGTAILFFALAGWTWSFVRKGKMIPFYFPAILFVGALLIGITGWKGGDLVSSYQNGGEQAAALLNAPPPDEAVDAFFAGLMAGDVEAIRAVTAADVLILESGGAERSLAEYESHHMPSDMAFLAAMEREILSREVRVLGKTAFVTTESRLLGAFRETEYNLMSAETMVLEFNGADWKIIHIHWSSRPIRE